MVQGMKFVSLFAGVGGFDLGLTRSGHTCVGQVEIDKHARGMLDKQFPAIPKHDDVTTARDWADEIGLTGNIDLVAGGFPCQDLSVAGKRAGLDGKRSGLFFDALAFATHTKAKTILLENVPGLLSSNQGRDFGVLLTHLANAGFGNIEWRVLDSQFFGVPQRRRRVFIVASLGTEPFRQILSQREGSLGDSSSSEQARKDSARTVTTSTRTSGFTGTSFGGYASGVGTLRAQGGDLGGGSETLITFPSENDVVKTLAARDYKGVGNQMVGKNKVVLQQAFGQSSFAGFTEGVTTLTATDYKRPEQNVVVCEK